MKLVYACYGKAGLDILYQLLNQKEYVSGNILVFTYADEGNKALIDHLEALGIRYSTAGINALEAVEEIRAFSPDYLFSVYFRDIIGKDVLGIVKGASVNLHPSLLPDYKGCFSAPWAIINGEEKTGITYHIMVAGVDTGDIILQREIRISGGETAFSLYHRLVALGTETFAEMFNLIVRKGCHGTAQPSGGRRYKRGVPNGGFFKIEDGIEYIDRFIRAMYFPPFEGAKLEHEGKVYEFRTFEEFKVFCAKKGIGLG